MKVTLEIPELDVLSSEAVHHSWGTMGVGPRSWRTRARGQAKQRAEGDQAASTLRDLVVQAASEMCFRVLPWGHSNPQDCWE